MLIDDSTSNDVLFDPTKARGCIPPDYAMHPEARPLPRIAPGQLPLIPRSEWSARCAEKKAMRSRLSDIRRTSGPGGNAIPSLQQTDPTGRYKDGSPCWGYCWAHSATMGHMLVRACMGQPYVKLSAFMVAALIKQYRNQGGWGALALDFIEKNGQPSVGLWPENGVDPKYDTPAMRADAARHKITADWADLGTAVYERNLTLDQVATLLLSNVPVVGDFNWWGHSVILMDWEEVEPGSFGARGLNSWGDGWGDMGEFVLRGNKTIPDGATAPLSVMAA